MMTLEELKGFLNSLPEEYNSYGIVNGEVGIIKNNDKEDVVYRCDKPIISLYVDDSSREVCFFHQTQEEVTEIAGETFFGTDNLKDEESETK